MDSIPGESGVRFRSASWEQKYWQEQLWTELGKAAGWRTALTHLEAAWAPARQEVLPVLEAANWSPQFPALVFTGQEPPAVIDQLGPGELDHVRSVFLSPASLVLGEYLDVLGRTARRFGLTSATHVAPWARERLHAQSCPTYIVPTAKHTPVLASNRAILIHASLAGAFVEVREDLDSASGEVWQATIRAEEPLSFSAWDQLEARAIDAVQIAIGDLKANVQRGVDHSGGRVVRRYAANQDDRVHDCRRLARVLGGLEHVQTRAAWARLKRLADLIEIDMPARQTASR